MSKLTRSQVASLGGIKRAEQQKAEAIEKYYLNPRICEFCSKVIQLRDGKGVGWIKRNRFCNHKCAASFLNRKRPKKEKVIPPKVERPIHKDDWTKGELWEKRKNYQGFRGRIQKGARARFEKSNKPKECFICGYKNHYEVSHNRAVSDFPMSALISEINDISNLTALCPNHHWEYEKGIVKI